MLTITLLSIGTSKSQNWDQYIVRFIVSFERTDTFQDLCFSFYYKNYPHSTFQNVVVRQQLMNWKNWTNRLVFLFIPTGGYFLFLIFFSLSNSLMSTHILVLYLWEKVMWFGQQIIGVVNSRLNLISRWPKSWPTLGIASFTLPRVVIMTIMVIEFQQFGLTRPNTFIFVLVLVETRIIAKIFNTN